MDSVFRQTVLCSTFALVALALAAGAAEDLLAGFSPTKAGARLKWVTPAPGPTCAMKDGAVVITVPQAENGFNHWVDGVADSPMLKADAPAGEE